MLYVIIKDCFALESRKIHQYNSCAVNIDTRTSHEIVANLMTYNVRKWFTALSF